MPALGTLYRVTASRLLARCERSAVATACRQSIASHVTVPSSEHVRDSIQGCMLCKVSKGCRRKAQLHAVLLNGMHKHPSDWTRVGRSPPGSC